ncbi:MAG TPA: hypothetical protein VFS05_00885 [Gemmatimonadaceae bacterium]|nr:hypothetical protein [Gemmatimonadaceae bacterium]
MERNPNDGFGTNEPTQSGGAGYGGAGSTGSTGAGMGGSSGMSGGTSSGTEFGGGSYGGGTADRSSTSESSTRTREGTRERLDAAREQAKEKLGQARERAGELKATLADKLDAGAERLRQRAASSSTGTPAMASAGVDVGTTEVASQQDSMARMNDKLASGMKSTATWLRNNDLDSMRSSLESEVRTNPGRSLLIAAVAGYLLGKAFKK